MDDKSNMTWNSEWKSTEAVLNFAADTQMELGVLKSFKLIKYLQRVIFICWDNFLTLQIVADHW